MKRIKLEGTKIGKVSVKDYIGNGLYRCHCDCGKEFTSRSNHLKEGRVHSCGCENPGQSDKPRVGKNIKNKTGYYGVKQTTSGRYESYFTAGKKRIHVGTFDTIEEAVAARNRSITSVLTSVE